MEWKHVTWGRLTNATPVNSTLVSGALTQYVPLVLHCCARSFKHTASCRPSKEKTLQGKFIEPWYLQIISGASENCGGIFRKSIGIKTPHTNWIGREADFLIWFQGEQKRLSLHSLRRDNNDGEKAAFLQGLRMAVPFLSSLTSISTNGACLPWPCSEPTKLCLMGIPGLHL